MRKIFIDIGGHTGDSIRYFRENWTDWKDYEYFVFEPLPENVEKLKKFEGVTVIDAAATIYTSQANFYTGLPQSGSLSDKKRTGKLDGKTFIRVKTIDFPGWVEATLLHPSSPYVPEITIKMNCEGAEYDIIEKMYYMGIVPYIKRWFVNWHWSKIGMTKEWHESIAKLIHSEPWKAML